MINEKEIESVQGVIAHAYLSEGLPVPERITGHVPWMVHGEGQVAAARIVYISVTNTFAVKRYAYVGKSHPVLLTSEVQEE